MQADRHSMTAVMMAVLRSHHASGPRPCIFEDSLAHALVSPAECEALERASLGLLESVDPALAASCTDREMSIQHALRVGPGVGPLARARYVEDSLFEALAHGAHQYVIIGAGLDTLAFRRPDLQDQLQVIEIDHPATQAFKRALGERRVGCSVQLVFCCGRSRARTPGYRTRPHAIRSGSADVLCLAGRDAVPHPTGHLRNPAIHCRPGCPGQSPGVRLPRTIGVCP